MHFFDFEEVANEKVDSPTSGDAQDDLEVRGDQNCRGHGESREESFAEAFEEAGVLPVFEMWGEDND